MDLYVSPLTCSFAAHVACLEAELPVKLHWVDRATKRLEDGGDYRAVAPLGMVPALAMDGGVVTEMGAVMQRVADAVPHKELAPRWGSSERYSLIAWLHFVATELHKKHLWMIYSAKTPDAVKEWARTSASESLEFVAKHLEGKRHLLGEPFTVADAYLFWALMILPFGGVPLTRWPVLEAYVAQVRERPSVKAALAVELPRFQKDRA